MRARQMPPGMPYLVVEKSGARLVSPFWVHEMKIDPETGNLIVELPEPTPLREKVLAVFPPVRDAVIDVTVRVVYWSLVGFLFVASALVYVTHRSTR